MTEEYLGATEVKASNFARRLNESTQSSGIFQLFDREVAILAVNGCFKQGEIAETRLLLAQGFWIKNIHNLATLSGVLPNVLALMQAKFLSLAISKIANSQIIGITSEEKCALFSTLGLEGFAIANGVPSPTAAELQRYRSGQKSHGDIQTISLHLYGQEQFNAGFSTYLATHPSVAIALLAKQLAAIELMNDSGQRLASKTYSPLLDKLMQVNVAFISREILRMGAFESDIGKNMLWPMDKLQDNQ